MIWPLVYAAAVITAPAAQARVAEMRAVEIGARLRAVQDDDLTSGPVPGDARRLLREFHLALRDAVVANLPLDGPRPLLDIQQELLTRLQAGLTERVPDARSGPYAMAIDLELRALARRDDIVLAAATASIKCGSDTALHVLVRRGEVWRAIATIASAPSATISDAWGYFQFAAMPPNRDGRFTLVIANVNPWCSSSWQTLRYAAYSVDPGRGTRRIFSAHRTVFLGDGSAATIEVSESHFTLRFTGSHPDPEILTRPYELRYQVVGTRVRFVSGSREPR
jgi:hypothetical protein